MEKQVTYLNFFYTFKKKNLIILIFYKNGIIKPIKSFDSGESNNKSPLKLSPDLSSVTTATWIDKFKKARINKITKTNSSDSQPCQSKTPAVKTYRRSSISALITTPILKKSDKKKYVSALFQPSQNNINSTIY